MQQVLFIGGGNAYQNREDFIEELKKWDYDPFEVKKKWKYSLSENLGDDYQVALLDMPNKNIALYKEWKIQFEKAFQYLSGDQIIIAHSLGTIFILKYLAENGFPKKIKQLHLVSALIDNKDLPPEESYIGDFDFDTQKIPEIVKNVITKVEDTEFERCYFKKMNDYSLDFLISYKCLSPDYKRMLEINEKINLGLFEEFEKKGIEFAFPSQTIYTYNLDDKAKEKSLI